MTLVPGACRVDVVASSSVVQLCLLGSFEVATESCAVQLPATAQRLLAFIALHDHPVQRMYAAGTLWPDACEQRAAGSLRSAIWRLRGPACDLVEASGPALRLAASVEADVTTLIRLSGGLGSRTRDTAELVDLIGRYDNELLPDWYDDWVIVWRERWRQVRLHALESLAEMLTRRGCHWAAIEAALAAVRAEPLRESAHRALISVYLAEGNHHEAVRQYEAYRRLLDEEMGLQPSAQIEALVRNLTSR